MIRILKLPGLLKSLYSWLKTELRLQSYLSNQSVSINTLVTKAVKEYKGRIVLLSPNQRNVIYQETLRKQLSSVEVRSGYVIVPKNKWKAFPEEGNSINITDSEDGSHYTARMVGRHRIDMKAWFSKRKVKSGDELFFLLDKHSIEVGKVDDRD